MRVSFSEKSDFGQTMMTYCFCFCLCQFCRQIQFIDWH